MSSYDAKLEMIRKTYDLILEARMRSYLTEHWVEDEPITRIVNKKYLKSLILSSREQSPAKTEVSPLDSGIIGGGNG